MHYLLYFPGQRGANPQHFDECGLEDLRRDGTPEMIETVEGPDGGRGMVAMWRSGDPETDSAMEHFKVFDWSESVPTEDLPKGAYWVGISKSKPPTPTDLKRPTEYRGALLKLSDGHEWLIPSAYYLPHYNGLDRDTGKFERRSVDNQFFRYEARAAVYAMQIFSREDEIEALCKLFPGADASKEMIEIPLEDSWEHACEGIAINYRLNEGLIDLLGILKDDRSILGACCASFDLQLIEETVKKKESPSPIGIPAGRTWLPEKQGTQ